MKYDTLDGPVGETLMNLEEEEDELQITQNSEKELAPNDEDVVSHKNT